MKDMNRTSTMTHNNNMNQNEKGDVSMMNTTKNHTTGKTAATTAPANEYKSIYTFNPENLKAFDLYSPAMKKAAKNSGNSGMPYAKAFWENIAAPDASPRVMNALSVGIDSNGGYTVPEEFHNQLIQAMEEDHPLIGRTYHFSCGHGELKIPIVDKKGEAFWVEELGLIPESAPSFKNHTLEAHKLGREVRISNEFISETAIEWQNFIRDAFARCFAASIEQAMLFGDGDHKLDGMLEGNYPAEFGAVSKSGSLAADDLIDLLYPCCHIKCGACTVTLCGIGVEGDGLAGVVFCCSFGGSAGEFEQIAHRIRTDAAGMRKQMIYENGIAGRMVVDHLPFSVLILYGVGDHRTGKTGQIVCYRRH